VRAQKQDEKHDDGDEGKYSDADIHGVLLSYLPAQDGCLIRLGQAGWAGGPDPGAALLARPGDPPCQLLGEGVFDFLAGLLEVALGLVGVAFGFERLVAGDLPGGFPDLAFGLLGGVLGLVFCARGAISLFPAMARPPGFGRCGGTCRGDAGQG
jgi:hypothetical protein